MDPVRPAREGMQAVLEDLRQLVGPIEQPLLGVSVQRAERRYRAVDPDNRLVARGLEAQWEQCLRTLDQARNELTRREQLRPQQITPEKREHILTLGRDLQQLWNAPSTSLRDRKDLPKAVTKFELVPIVMTAPPL